MSSDAADSIYHRQIVSCRTDDIAQTVRISISLLLLFRSRGDPVETCRPRLSPN